MHDKPLGIDQHYCSQCGSEVVACIPAGDNKLRYVCDQCSTVHYENPKLVVGCVTEHAGQNTALQTVNRAPLRILDRTGWFHGTRRDTGAGCLQGDPGRGLRKGCARRHARRGRCARGRSSACILIGASLLGDHYAAGDESLDARLYAPEEIPWDEIAFSSGRIALEAVHRPAAKRHGAPAHRGRAA